MELQIQEWTPEHPSWHDLAQEIAEQQQTHWAFGQFFERFSRLFLVALMGQEVGGFIIFVVWEIGPHDRGHQPLLLNGEVLTEAKVIAFGMRETHRRQGIGRALREQLLARAKELNCYQVRSVSDHEHPENHQLKLSMGFSAVPMERDEPSVTFVMPLR